MCLIVYAVEMFVQTSFRQQGGICTSAVLLNKVKMKMSILANFVVCLFGDYKHRVVLFAAKLVLDANFSDILFHNHIPFVFQNSL